MFKTYPASIPEEGKSFRFMRLLFKWRGSMYKLIMVDWLVFLGVYYVLNFIYRFTMTAGQKDSFHIVCRAMTSYNSRFSYVYTILGFFVAEVLFRWWRIFEAIPLLIQVVYNINGLVMSDNNIHVSRKVRLTAIRYFMLSWIFAMLDLSTFIRDRFVPHRKSPSEPVDVQWQSLVKLLNSDEVIMQYFRKLLTESEQDALLVVIKIMPHDGPCIVPWYIPLQWLIRHLKKATRNGFIEVPMDCLALCDKIVEFQERVQLLITYSKFSVPLVYSQVLMIGMYYYYATMLLGTQVLIPHVIHPSSVNASANETFATAGGIPYVDVGVPVFAFLQLAFVMGWFRVAMALLDPFGSDEQDFPTSAMLDTTLPLSHWVTDNPRLAFPMKLKEANFRDVRDLNMLHSFSANDLADSDSDGEWTLTCTTNNRYTAAVDISFDVRNIDSDDELTT